MKNALKISALFLFAIALFTGCKKDQKIEDLLKQNMTFLKVGNEWNYDVARFDTLSNGRDTSYTVINARTFKITKSISENSYELLRTMQLDTTIIKDSLVWYNDTTGFYEHPIGNVTAKIKLFFLQGHTGNDWFTLNGTDTIKCKEIALSTPVQVPMKSFNDATQVKRWNSKTPKDYTMYYFHRTVGIVKQEEYTNEKLKTSISLRSTKF